MLPLPADTASEKLSARILEFASPILAGKESNPEAYRTLLEFAIMVWNAHSLAMSIWAEPGDLQKLAAKADETSTPAVVKEQFRTLASRRTLWSDDARLVREWEFSKGASERYELRCVGVLPKQS